MDQPQSFTSEVIDAALRTAPPATVYAFTLEWWIGIATLAWIVLQTAYLIRKWWREERGRK